MKSILICIFVILFFVFAFIALFRSKKMVESFSNYKIKNPNILLLGDYVLHESNGIRTPSLKAILQKMYPLGNIKVLSTKCATIDDITKQMSSIPPSWNSKNTIAFVSVGSIDMYKNILNCKSIIGMEDNSKSTACLSSTNLKDKWMQVILAVKDKFSKINMIILGSYYPDIDTSITACDISMNITSPYISDINSWNQGISNFAEKNGLDFIGLEKVLSSTNKKLFQPDSLLLSPLGVRKLANVLGVMISSKLRSSKKNLTYLS